jgi:hypothetical protein
LDKLSRYTARGHKFVEGWLLPGAISMVTSVAKAQQISGHVAEIGVHHGKLFTLLYLLSREDERAVAIDLFGDQHANIDRSGHGDRARFLANLRKHADDARLVIHQGDSTKVTGDDLKRLAGGEFRLISVDGGHTAEITAHDLGTAETALTRGGIIILDDCFNEMWPGVSEGVNRYFSEPRSIAPFAIGGNKALFCHPEFSEIYASASMSGAPTVVRHEFLGSPVLCGDFAPLPLTQQIGKMPLWKAIKDMPPLKLARRAYHAILHRT